MVLKKNKVDNKILFLDASNECVKVTNSNKLTDENIETIIGCWVDRKNKKHVAKLVTIDDVAEQDYNLSVSTYVEQKDTREKIDIDQLNKDIEEVVKRENELRKAIDKIIADLRK